MGFSRDAIRKEADKTFKGLEIDDTAEGVVVLRNQLRLTDDEKKELDAHTKKFEAIQKDEEATVADLRKILIDMAECLADRKGILPEYLSDFSDAELLAVYSLWAKETQAGESKSSK